MTEINPPKQITNFDELTQMYSFHAIALKNKGRESYWLRYLFRRLPLFSGFGLIFFCVCLALEMNNMFSGKIDDFFHSLILFDKGFRDHILIGSVVLLLLRSFLPWTLFVDKYGKEAGAEINNESNTKNKTFRKMWTEYWEKPITLLLVLSALISGFSWIISHPHALLLGLIIFSVVTFGSLLADRMLGFTRRNERYQLFANRAEGLIVESRSWGKIDDKSGDMNNFNEKHLLECAAFFEELRLDKHNAAMRDSFYLLRLKEKLLGRVI
ncbi:MULTISPECIES: antiviral RADAR system accessory protein RdrD [Aeromonas]|uniref:antiviral RADAR system accessory protein RdrD n=1 Tax=Aeromonas TaxID=642 RepID=UPI000B310739|nr:antiviral RADAR system accessory protein RdrD [Aeromonas dhakensis]